MMSFLMLCGTPGMDADGCGKIYPADMFKCPKCGQASIFNSAFAANPRDYLYDLETYPNTFTMRVTHTTTRMKWRFEISDRVDQLQEIIDFVYALKQCGARMVGYNNIGFDYPVLHYIVTQFINWPSMIYDKAMSIIRGPDRFGHIIWPNDRIVEQIDLFKIRHYDNVAKATSLKALEFAMRMKNIEDLPFDVGKELDHQEKEILHTYNDHDVEATGHFYARTIEEIEFREELTARYGRDFMNHNDTKIGKDYFIMKLEEHGIQCFYRDGNNKRQPRQTIRPYINLGDVIFPYVQFERPEFQQIRNLFASKTITETKGVFKDMHTKVDGLTYHFGTGGLHASVESQIVHSDDEYQIVDVDVASYYPNLAIKNRMYPAHLGEFFCDVYEDVYQQRKSHPKGTPPNAMMKLALNGVYGDSNNVHSPFYDPAYTMGITINGQLLLCMLVEQLIKIPGLTMVQANTDGVTFRCPRAYMDHQRAVCAWWERLTCLELEEALYSRMMIRDVNSYMAERTDGKLKHIGAYRVELQYHQDQSAMVVPKAAEAALVHGTDIREFIEAHDDPFDFMLRAKVPRGSRCMLRWPEYDAEIQLANTTRYFVSRGGGEIVKVSPPTGHPGSWKRKAKLTDRFYSQVVAEITAAPAPPNAPVDSLGVPWDERIHTKSMSTHDTREMGMCVGWRVTECSDADDFDWLALNRDYYVAEAEKLVTPLVNGTGVAS